MNKIVITLKQHTPILHFQPSQEGATLRASEVKPKLDKFLLKTLGNGDYDKGKKNAEEKGWLIGDSNALNYKMRIDANGQTPDEYLVASYLNRRNIEKLNGNRILVLPNTPFFAQEQQNGEICRNIDKWRNLEKKGLMFKQPINIQIITKSEDKELALSISNNIQLFFLSTNFGTRQTKGFGSFSVIEIINNNIVLQDKEKLLRKSYEFVCKCTESFHPTDFASIFNSINDNYKLLKSGKNKPYKKSLLRNFVEENYNYLWEKRFIKRKFAGQFEDENGDLYVLRTNQQTKIRYNRGEQYRFIRIMLGLAEQFEFLLDNERTNKMILKFESKDQSIERFASPLLFKVIDGSIYILVNEIPQDVFDKTFECLVTFKEDDGYDRESIGDLKTLSEFSLVEFMKYACNDEDFKYNIL